VKGNKRDVSMMNDPERWPGAHLCVKKDVEEDDMPQCALMDQDFNIFEYSGTKIASFNSAKEVVHAGWMVD